MSEIKKILLLGAGGHCLSVLDSLLSSYDYREIGIIEKKENITVLSDNIKKQDMISGIPILGDDDDLCQLYEDGYAEAFITVGSIGDASVRARLYHMIKDIGYHIPNIIDKTGVISPYVKLGEGIYVGKNAIINAGAQIRNGAIINTASIIEHECVIGEFVHVAPGSIICGNVHIESGTHIGAGSVIKQGLQIGEETMIGAGSIVVKNIGSHTTAYGNPCKEV